MAKEKKRGVEKFHFSFQNPLTHSWKKNTGPKKRVPPNKVQQRQQRQPLFSKSKIYIKIKPSLWHALTHTMCAFGTPIILRFSDLFPSSSLLNAENVCVCVRASEAAGRSSAGDISFFFSSGIFLSEYVIWTSYRPRYEMLNDNSLRSGFF